VIVEMLKLKALEIGLGWIIGPLALLTMQLLKRYVAWVESRDAWTKRALVVATSAVLTALGAALGIDFGVSDGSISGLGMLEKETVVAGLGAVVAMGLHAVRGAVKKKP
jgi:hypothetical protein